MLYPYKVNLMRCLTLDPHHFTSRVNTYTITRKKMGISQSGLLGNNNSLTTANMIVSTEGP